MVLIHLPVTGITSDVLVDALLRKQYFPNIKKTSGEELPPYFSSESLTDAAAADLLNLESRDRGVVRFGTRKFDGLVRPMGLPHPVAHVRLVNHLGKYWTHLDARLGSEQSKIAPRHHDDGRVLTMDYDDQLTESNAQTQAATGRRFVVKADISNCFGSIYTHAVDWALRGRDAARRGRRDNSWEHKLDLQLQRCNGGETKGINIGPAVSNIVAEFILQEVDLKLAGILATAFPRSGLQFTRNIDDYTLSCDTNDQAELFLTALGQELAHFRLSLNGRKTSVQPTVGGIGERWIADIHLRLPDPTEAEKAVRFVQWLGYHADDVPGKSVARYGAKTLVKERLKTGQADESDLILADELLRLAFHRPETLCFAVQHLEWSGSKFDGNNRVRLGHSLHQLLEQAAQRRETDTALWAMRGLESLSRTEELNSKSTRDALIALEDDLVWLVLAHLHRDGMNEVATAAELLNAGNNGDVPEDIVEEHWLARYELHRTERLQEVNLSKFEKQWFKKAINHSVSFSILT
ncbi:MAG: RNA-directed DNA polymerase [Cellulomonadaceae bacterium]|jgi:hypothetical protein|nr:RNA-directed DNA polymerase [Cellulomonadaceae bacterium]